MDSDASERLTDLIQTAQDAPVCMELNSRLYQALEASSSGVPPWERHAAGSMPTFQGVSINHDPALDAPSEEGPQLGIAFYTWEERIQYRELDSFERLVYATTPHGEPVSKVPFATLLGAAGERPIKMTRGQSITIVFKPDT